VKVFAYCTEPAGRMVGEAVGVSPLTSPPMTAADFRPSLLEGYDFIYIRLHGLPQVLDLWLGERLDGGLLPALTRNHIEAADLTDAVILLANCYGASSPMAQEMYDSGARAVIAGHGPNYAAGKTIRGADLLAKWFLIALRGGAPPPAALTMAKSRLAMSSWRKSDRDTLEFSIIRSIKNE